MGKTSRLVQQDSHQCCGIPSKGRNTGPLNSCNSFVRCIGSFPFLLLGWAAILDDIAVAFRAGFALFASFFSKLLPGVCISRNSFLFSFECIVKGCAALMQAAQSDQRGSLLTCTLLLHSAKVQFILLFFVYGVSSERLYGEAHLSFGKCSGFAVLN